MDSTGHICKSNKIETITIGTVNTLPTEQCDELSIEVMTQVRLCLSISNEGIVQVHSVPGCEVIWREPLLPLLLDAAEDGECEKLLSTLSQALDTAKSDCERGEG
jgi:hypothetical protein